MIVIFVFIGYPLDEAPGSWCRDAFSNEDTETSVCLL